MRDINDIRIKVGDIVKTRQPSGGILPPAEPVTGIVVIREYCGKPEPMIVFREEPHDWDKYIMLKGKINEVL